MLRFAFLLAALCLVPGAVAAECGPDIDKAFAAMYAAKPFRSELVAKGTGDAVRTVSEVGLGDTARITTEAAGGKTQIVIIGDRIWRDGGDGHVEMPAEVAKALAAQFRANQGKPVGQIANAKCSETDTRDGRAFRVFEYEQTFQVGGGDGISSARLLVDKATGLPAFMEVTSSAMGIMSMSLLTVTFDPAIRIEAPQVKPAEVPAPGPAPGSQPEKK